MLRSIISSCFLLYLISGVAQETPGGRQASDSLVYTQPYGLRVGIDLSRPAQTFLNDDYRGFEIVGDYRLSEKLYLAAELGNEDRSSFEELGNENNPNRAILYDYTTSGSYLKIGVDLNTYENWYGMNNTIYIGGRYALSTLSQTLNSYQLLDTNRYWNPDGLQPGSGLLGEYGGLNASWLEFVFGMKAELFANIYLGGSVRLGFLLGNKEDERLPNLWIPGFNKVTEGSRFGVGYNYSISYMIPLYRKAKKPKPVTGEAAGTP